MIPLFTQQTCSTFHKIDDPWHQLNITFFNWISLYSMSSSESLERSATVVCEREVCCQQRCPNGLWCGLVLFQGGAMLWTKRSKYWLCPSKEYGGFLLARKGYSESHLYLSGDLRHHLEQHEEQRMRGLETCCERRKDDWSLRGQCTGRLVTLFLCLNEETSKSRKVRGAVFIPPITSNPPFQNLNRFFPKRRTFPKFCCQFTILQIKLCSSTAPEWTHRAENDESCRTIGCCVQWNYPCQSGFVQCMHIVENPRRKDSAAIVIITIGQHLVLLGEVEAVKKPFGSYKRFWMAW